MSRVPAVILGGSGYVAGEVLRLLAGHGGIWPAAVLSESQAGEPVEESVAVLLQGLKGQGLI